MASRFATVSKYKMLAINEDKIGLVGVYWLLEKKFLTEFATKS